MSNLLQRGTFRLHSGDVSDFKIDCDAFTNEDIETCAYLLNQRLKPFNHVIGIAGGGIRLGAALLKYQTSQMISNLLICDDVLTTGQSMITMKNMMKDRWKTIQGAVIFNRLEYPLVDISWITSLFKLGCII